MTSKKKATEDWAVWALIGVCVLALIGLGVLMTTLEPKEYIRRDCIRAGYLDYERIGRTLICVGVIDGHWQIEPLADVRARMDGLRGNQ